MTQLPAAPEAGDAADRSTVTSRAAHVLQLWRAMWGVTPGDGAGVDRTDGEGPRANPWLALAVVLAAYLCFFGQGVVRAIQIYTAGVVMPPDDYSSNDMVSRIPLWAGQIAVAALLLYVVMRLWSIPPALAGVARRQPNPWPSVFTVLVAFGGLGVAGFIKGLIDGDGLGTLHGGTVSNGWVAFAVLRDLNAGVVEEIVIVALPVLLLRRAGWSVPAVLALSVALRWPFHIYHGLWSSLPWAVVWGGAFCLAYVYFRRLWPLVVVHALLDITIALPQGWGVIGGVIAATLIVGGVISLVVRVGRYRLTRLTHRRRPSVWQAWSLSVQNMAVVVIAVIAIIVGVVVAALVQLVPAALAGDGVATTLAGQFGVITLVLALVGWVVFYICCWCVVITDDAALRRDRGKRCRVAWYAAREPGRIVISSTMNVDLTRVLPFVAAAEPQGTEFKIAGLGPTAARELTTAGYTVTGRFTNRSVTVDRTTALHGPVDDAAPASSQR